MDRPTSLRKNPSRETCENNIRRILMTEVLQHGTNQTFRSAADFMSFFESLYPASDALTKQVQRAVKAMDMPKDENGFFIVNKTVAQLDQEKEISHIFSIGHVAVNPLDQCEVVFLEVEPSVRSYLAHTISTSATFAGKVITIVETYNGLMLYTPNKNQLLILLNSLTI